MYQEDAILVNQALQGDQNSFGKLIEKYQHQIYGLAFHWVRNFADAEDIAQEVFLVAYENLGNLREPAKFSPWLKGIAENLIKMWNRQKGRTESIDDFTESEMDELIAPMSPPTPEEHYEKREIQEKVMRAVSALPEPNRLVVSLYYIDGLSYSDISEFLEIPVGTVRSRLHRAKTQLKGEMIGMVKEMFEEHPLPKEFSRKVQAFIAGGEQLENGKWRAEVRWKPDAQREYLVDRKEVETHEEAQEFVAGYLEAKVGVPDKSAEIFERIISSTDYGDTHVKLRPKGKQMSVLFLNGEEALWHPPDFLFAPHSWMGAPAENLNERRRVPIAPEPKLSSRLYADILRYLKGQKFDNMRLGDAILLSSMDGEPTELLFAIKKTGKSPWEIFGEIEFSLAKRGAEQLRLTLEEDGVSVSYLMRGEDEWKNWGDEKFPTELFDAIVWARHQESPYSQFRNHLQLGDDWKECCDVVMAPFEYTGPEEAVFVFRYGQTFTVTRTQLEDGKTLYTEICWYPRCINVVVGDFDSEEARKNAELPYLQWMGDIPAAPQELLKLYTASAGRIDAQNVRIIKRGYIIEVLASNDGQSWERPDIILAPTRKSLSGIHIVPASCEPEIPAALFDDIIGYLQEAGTQPLEYELPEEGLQWKASLISDLNSDATELEYEISVLKSRPKPKISRVGMHKQIITSLKHKGYGWLDRQTEVYNYAYFWERIRLELECAQRHRTPISLLLVDIDRFREFNKKYGHPDGDKLLRRLAKLLADNTPEPGIVIRYGGEEFVLLLPETDKDEAIAYAEKIRSTVEQTEFQTSMSQTFQITISIGVATYTVDDEEDFIIRTPNDQENLIMKADVALRQAKQAGRNQSVAYKRKHIELMGGKY